LGDGEEEVIEDVEILWILDFVEVVVVVRDISNEGRVFVEVGGEGGSINVKPSKAFAVDGGREESFIFFLVTCRSTVTVGSIVRRLPA
jgi:hypothetical protein